MVRCKNAVERSALEMYLKVVAEPITLCRKFFGTVRVSLLTSLTPILNH